MCQISLGRLNRCKPIRNAHPGNFKGIPEAGLEIKNNHFGDRTFFCESWPNIRVEFRDNFHFLLMNYDQVHLGKFEYWQVFFVFGDVGFYVPDAKIFNILLHQVFS